MANNTSMLQKWRKNVVLLVLSAAFPFLVSANPAPTSDDWEDWVEQQAQIEQAQIEQAQDDNDNRARVENATPQIPCLNPVECGIKT